MDDIHHGIDSMLCLKKATSKFMRSMNSSLKFLQPKQIAEKNGNREQEALPEKENEEAIAPLSYQDSMENWVNSTKETLQKYLKVEKTESQDHRDSALSDPQENVDADQHLEKFRKCLLMLSFLAVTITYQAGLNPPGGLCKANAADGPRQHCDGDPILQITYPQRYLAFFYCNAIAFVASLVILILLLSNIFNTQRMHWALKVAMILDIFGLICVYDAGRARKSDAAADGDGRNRPIQWSPVEGTCHVELATTHDMTSIQDLLLTADYSRFVLDGRAANRDVPLLVRGRGKKKERTKSMRKSDPAADGGYLARRVCNPHDEATWHVVSAATHHMTGNQNLLRRAGYSPVVHDDGENILFVHLANGDSLRVCGSGKVRTKSIALDDVWYIPGLELNLVSTGQLAMQGCTMSFNTRGCRITMGDALVGSAHFTEESGQFVLDYLEVASSN